MLTRCWIRNVHDVTDGFFKVKMGWGGGGAIFIAYLSGGEAFLNPEPSVNFLS